MKIATYNLEFLFDAGKRIHSGKEYEFSETFVEERIAYFTKAFNQLDADVLFLQELGSPEVLKKIVQKLDAKYQYFVAAPDWNGVGNAVLYKDEQGAATSIPTITSMPVFREGDEDTLGTRMESRRDFVRLKTTLNDQPLVLIGIHLQANFLKPQQDKNEQPIPMHTQTEKVDGLIRTELFRLCQAKRVRESVDEVFAENKEALVGVCGDYNTVEADKPYRIIQGPDTEMPDSLLAATDRVPPEKRFSVYSTAKGARLIDHILVSRALHQRVQSAEIFNEGVHNHDENPNKPYIVESDHAPILVEVV